MAPESLYLSDYHPRFEDCGERAMGKQLYPPAENVEDPSPPVAPEENSDVRSSSVSKQYGQFFTPPSIAALACGATVFSDTKQVVDPMCGNGVMLSAAADRIQFMKQSCSDTPSGGRCLLGVEVDALQAKKATALCGENPILRTLGSVWQAEAFTEVLGLLRGTPDLSFEAVIGNPPYVRYQDMAFLLDEICPALVEAFDSQMNGANRSEVAQTIIRASLLDAVWGIESESLGELASEALQLLRKPERVAGQIDDPLVASWVRLVAGYSGLSDLSLPSWLLSWCLTSPGGYIALVSTSAWKNREYGRPLKYFMHRMLRPVAQIDQEQKSWFPDAEVDASLYVFQKRQPRKAKIPLSRRSDDSYYPHLRILHPHDLSDESTLCNLSRKMSGQSPGTLAEAADQVMCALRDSDVNVRESEYRIRQVSEKETVEDLLSGEKEGGLLWKLEGQEVSSMRHDSDGSRVRIPSSLRRDLHLPVSANQSVQTLGDYGVRVNQGLRTGCNVFFYLRSPTEEEWENLFSEHKPSEVREILASGSSNSSEALVIASRVEDRGGVTPSEQPNDWPAMQLVFADEEIGGMPCILPQSILVPAYRYQRELDGLAVRSNPKYWTFFVRNAVRPEDFQSIRERYSSSFIEAWQSEYNLTKLSSAPTKLINLGENTVLSRGGSRVRIPDMSAVSPNSRTPSGEVDLFQDAPPPPAWWYNLRIKPRHWGPLFMPRVNSSHPIAYTAQHNGQATLIDANFSTFSLKEDNISPQALFALLNSSWVRMALEYTSTTMGGGALKVEAAHLRRVPIPCLSSESLRQLHSAGESLQKPDESNEEGVLRRIDWVMAKDFSLDWSQYQETQFLEKVIQISQDKVQARNR